MRGVVPPGGKVRYRDPDDGWEYSHPYRGMVEREARKHRMEKGLEIVVDWERWIEERICEATPQACLEVAEVEGIDEPQRWGKLALQFAKAMFTWGAQGFKVMGWGAFRLRLEQCQGHEGKGIKRCGYYRASPGGIGFARCGKCGCTRVKLFLWTEKCPIGKWGGGSSIP